MKLVIDIPSEDFNVLQFHNAEEFSIDYIQEFLDRISSGEEIIEESRENLPIKGKCMICPHCECCDIPDNATNGDMLLELLKGQHDKIYPVGETQMGITLDCEWWNAPFKAESEDKK